jgi:hypothetical protein
VPDVLVVQTSALDKDRMLGEQPVEAVAGGAGSVTGADQEVDHDSVTLRYRNSGADSRRGRGSRPPPGLYVRRLLAPVRD